MPSSGSKIHPSGHDRHRSPRRRTRDARRRVSSRDRVLARGVDVAHPVAGRLLPHVAGQPKPASTISPPTRAASRRRGSSRDRAPVTRARGLAAREQLGRAGRDQVTAHVRVAQPERAIVEVDDLAHRLRGTRGSRRGSPTARGRCRRRSSRRSSRPRRRRARARREPTRGTASSGASGREGAQGDERVLHPRRPSTRAAARRPGMRRRRGPRSRPPGRVVHHHRRERTLRVEGTEARRPVGQVA